MRFLKRLSLPTACLDARPRFVLEDFRGGSVGAVARWRNDRNFYKRYINLLYTISDAAPLRAPFAIGFAICNSSVGERRRQNSGPMSMRSKRLCAGFAPGADVEGDGSARRGLTEVDFG